MQKAKFIGALTGILVLGYLSIACATLIDLGNGVIHDEAADQYWFQDLSVWSYKSYNSQLFAIDQLNNEDSGYWDDRWLDWRLADKSDILNLWEYDADDLGQHFTPTRPDIQMIQGRYEEASYSNGPTHFITHVYVQYGSWVKAGHSSYDVWDSVNNHLGAWVVADANPNSAPIPEPTTIVLFGTGLVALSRFRGAKSKSV